MLSSQHRMNSISVFLDEKFNNEEAKTYIELAKSLNIKEVFSSIHLPELSFKQQMEFVKELSKIVHENELKLTIDLRGDTLTSIEEDDENSELFSSIGIDCVRLDFGYDINKAINSLKKHHIGFVQINASVVTKDFLQSSLPLFEDAGIEVKACHNFYPRPETGLSVEKFVEQNKIMKQYGLDVIACVPSHYEPRGPIHEGLPTLEDHRHMNFEQILLELKYKYQIDEILFGDKISKSMLETARDIYSTAEYVLPLEIRLVNSKNKEDLLFKKHLSREDSGKYQIRIITSREMASINEVNIEPFNCIERSKHSITIDNKNYGRYQGEIQIVLEPLTSDNRVNVIAHILTQSEWKVDIIKEGCPFVFVEV